MCYPVQNNIGCIHFVAVSLQHSLQRRGFKHSNVGHKFIYVLLTMSPCAFIQKYLHVPGLDLVLGFGLRNCLLASFNITVKVIPQFLVDLEAT